MNTFFRRLMEVCRIHPRIRIPQAEYEEFWASRCWLALRQEVAARLDHYHGVLLSPYSEERQVWEARGSIAGLGWLLDSREEMQGRIAKEYDQVLASRSAETRLREVMKLFEEEIERARRSKQHNAGRAGIDGTDTVRTSGDRPRDTESVIRLASD